MTPGLNLRGIVIVAVLSLVILFSFAPIRTARPNGQMFFLGAGFMLLETKGVVQMALLFGSTWMVNSFVFAAILLMALLGNLYVLRFRPRRLWPYYVLLLASLGVSLCVPITGFLGIPGLLRIAVSCWYCISRSSSRVSSSRHPSTPVAAPTSTSARISAV